MVFRARGYITADAREQTAYGTARAYIDVGINTNDAGLQVGSLALSSNRAFLQWAGITAGLTQSFYDFYSVPAAQYRGGYLPASDTGDPGWFVWGYTAQLGNGLSATISTEARRTTQIINDATFTPVVLGIPLAVVQTGVGGLGTVTPGSFVGGAAGAALAPGNGAYGGMQVGDFVGNIRIDQTWGSAQVMAAAHRAQSWLLLTDHHRWRGRSSRRGPSRYRMGLCRRRRLALELPDDRPGRLLPVAGQLHPGRATLPVLHAQYELGQGERRQRNLRRSKRLRVRRNWQRYTGRSGDLHDGLPADHRLGRQRLLRTLLDSCSP